MLNIHSFSFEMQSYIAINYKRPAKYATYIELNHFYSALIANNIELD